MAKKSTTAPATDKAPKPSKTELAIVSGVQQAANMLTLAHPPEAKGGTLALTEARELVLHLNMAQLPAAVEISTAARTMIDTIKAHYKRLKDPFNTAIKNLREMEASDLQPWEQVGQIVDPAIVQVREQDRRERQAQADREQRERQAERDKALKDAQELQDILDELAAEKAGTPEGDALVTAALAQPEPVREVVAYVPPVKQDPMQGMMERRDYSAEVVQPAALVAAVAEGRVPAFAVQPAMIWLNSYAADKKVEGEILPGVIGVCKITLVRRPVGR